MIRQVPAARLSIAAAAVARQTWIINKTQCCPGRQQFTCSFFTSTSHKRTRLRTEDLTRREGFPRESRELTPETSTLSEDAEISEETEPPRTLQDVWKLLATQKKKRTSTPRQPSTRMTSSPEAMPDTLRKIMRNIPYPVSVVTCGYDKENPLGLTVASFNSISLDPPLITFNIKFPSTTGDFILQKKEFHLSILATNRHGQAAAELFSRPMSSDPVGDLENTQDGVKRLAFNLKTLRVMELPEKQVKKLDRFDDMVGKEHLVTDSVNGHGVKLNTQNCSAVFSCDLEHAFDVADHKIIVARVKTVITYADGSEERKWPLTYRNGRYIHSNQTRGADLVLGGTMQSKAFDRYMRDMQKSLNDDEVPHFIPDETASGRGESGVYSADDESNAKDDGYGPEQSSDSGREGDVNGNFMRGRGGGSSKPRRRGSGRD